MGEEWAAKEGAVTRVGRARWEERDKDYDYDKG